MSLGSRGLFLLVLGGALWACGGGHETLPPPDGARVVVTSPGDGAPSEAPLWPLRVGYRWHANNGVAAITRVTDRFGVELFLEQGRGPVLEQGRGPVGSQLVGHDDDMGRPETLWQPTTSGLAIRGVGANRLLPTPILAIPPTVRAGMAWDVLSDADEVVARGKISGGAVQATPFGSRRVWTVELTTVRRTLGDLEVWTRDFVEGFGPLGAAWTLVPLTDVPSSEPAGRRIELTPLGSHKAIDAVTSRSFSAVEDPDAPGTWQIGIGAFQPGVTPVQGNDYPYRDRRLCLDASAAGLAPTPLETTDGELPFDFRLGACEDAAMRVHLPSGAYARLPMDTDGTSQTDWKREPRCRPNELDCFHPPPYSPYSVGLFAGLDGRAYGLFTDHRYDYELGAKVIVGIGAVDRRTPYEQEQQGLSTFGGPDLYLGLPFLAWPESVQPTRAVALAPETPDGLPLVVHVGHWVVATQARARLVFPGSTSDSTTTPGDSMTWLAEEPARAMPDLDALVTLLRPDNTRELYQAAEDGVVWRVSWSRDDRVLRRSLLAALDLPDGHRLLGVMPEPDGTWLAVTEDGEAWVYDLGPTTVYQDTATQHLWRFTPPPPGPAEPPPLWLGLDVRPDGRDLRVCAPAGRALPLDGWTLGGEVPRLVQVSDHCLLLVRPHAPLAGVPDRDGPLLVPTAPSAWEVRVTLPDLGPVAIGLDPAAFVGAPLGLLDGSPRPVAAGGFTTRSSRTWPGFVPRESNIVRSRPLVGTGSPLVDFTVRPWWAQAVDPTCANATCPARVWTADWRGDEPMEWSLDYVPSALPPFTGELIQLLDGTPVWRREHDKPPAVELLDSGSTTSAPPVALGTAMWQFLRRCDPIEASRDPDLWVLHCQEPDGADRVSPLMGPTTNINVHHPLDLEFVVEGTYLRRLDRRTLLMQRVPIPFAERMPSGISLAAVADAADGSVWLLLREVDVTRPAWSILRMDREGLGLHHVTGGVADDQNQVGGLFVDTDLLVVLGGDGVTWRGFRSAEAPCAGPTCACPFGNVTETGTCAAAFAHEPTHPSCEAAVLADPSRALSGAWTRIDPDGFAGAEEPYWTHCAEDVVGEPEGMTRAPAVFAVTGGWFFTRAPGGGETTCEPLPGFTLLDGERERLPYGGSLDARNDSLGTSWQGVTAVPVLRGAFVLEFTVASGAGVVPSRLVLDRTDQFDPVTRRYLGAGTPCADDPSPAAIVFEWVTEPGDLLQVRTPDEAAIVQGAARLERGLDGVLIVRGATGTELWRSPVPIRHDLGLYGEGNVHLFAARWRAFDSSTCERMSCDGRTCGSDGCGGVCGVCDKNAACSAGACECGPGFIGDGITCTVAVGLDPDHPASSCAAAALAVGTIVPDAWVDPDADGPEPLFQATCPDDGFYMTVATTAFLPDGARALDRAAPTCAAWTGTSPVSVETGVGGRLRGTSVPAGLEAVATHHGLYGPFDVRFKLEGVTGAQRVGVHLDLPVAFDAALGYTGLHASCGGPSSTRISVWRTEGDVRVQVGEAPEQVTALPAAALDQPLRLKREEDGRVNLLHDGGVTPLLHTFAPRVGPVRLVGSATSGQGSVLVQSVRWLGEP